MYVIKIPYFDLQTIYKSMQSVRWERRPLYDHYGYYIPVGDDVIMVEQFPGNTVVFHCDEETFYNLMFNYFGVKTDYEFVYNSVINNHPGFIASSAMVNQGYRVIYPDLWEVVITQLFSVGNSMLQVKHDVKDLCRVLGEQKTKRYPNKPAFEYYTFPDFETVFIDRDLLRGEISNGNYRKINRLCKVLYREGYGDALTTDSKPFLGVLYESGLYSPRAIQNVALNGFRELRRFPASTYAHDEIRRIFGLNMRDFRDWYLSDELKDYRGIVYGYMFGTDIRDKQADEWERVLY